MEKPIPITVPPPEAIRTVRQLIESAGWSCERSSSSRPVERMAIIIPMMERARTLGVRVTSGPLDGLEIHAWSARTGSAGDLHHIEWPYDQESTEGAHLFRAWAARCPRAPFRWTFGERSMVGYFLPEFRRSRRMFERRGVPTGRGRWPDADAMAWPADHIEAKSQFNHGTEEDA